MIVIAGDSWGRGEWSGNRLSEDAHNTETVVIHQGLQAYLIEQGHQVVNVSREGSSNLQVAQAVKDCLGGLYRSNQIKSVTNVFVFQTDWIRDFMIRVPPDIDDLVMPLKNKKFWKPVVTQDLISKYISRVYYKLSDIAGEFDVRIGLIGGLSDSEWFDNFEIEYPGLFVACQSLTNLCLHDDHRVQHPVYGTGFTDSPMHFCIGNAEHTETKEFFIAQFELYVERLQQIVKNPQWFFPNGTHPNRHAHKKLYEHLRSQKYF